MGNIIADTYKSIDGLGLSEELTQKLIAGGIKVYGQLQSRTRTSLITGCGLTSEEAMEVDSALERETGFQMKLF